MQTIVYMYCTVCTLIIFTNYISFLSCSFVDCSQPADDVHDATLGTLSRTEGMGDRWGRPGRPRVWRLFRWRQWRRRLDVGERGGDCRRSQHRYSKHLERWLPCLSTVSREYAIKSIPVHASHSCTHSTHPYTTIIYGLKQWVLHSLTVE